ncbi:MAG: hypothetical protein R2823_10540 [Acidimicrobiia bacterium]
MTSEPHAAGDKPAEEPSAANDIAGAAMNVSNQLTAGERLIALGCLIILVVDLLIGTWILDDYGLSNSSWLIPLGILVAMYFYYSGKQRAWHAHYGTLVRVGAWAIALIALSALIDETLITSFRYSGSTLFFEIAFWVAGGLCAVGAWQFRSDDR